MSVYYYTEHTNLDTNNPNLFDIKTKKTNYGRDLDLNSANTISRIVGLDKLVQQTEKIVFLNTDTYESAPDLGVDLFKQSNTTILNYSISKAFNQYASLQQQQQTQSNFLILGRNIYRSRDISNIEYWEKINKNIISSNKYIDSGLITDTEYFYATTKVYKDSLGNTRETKIEILDNVIATSDNTLSAKINDDFVFISDANSVILYWDIPIPLNLEEQLRSIVSINSFKLGDPRALQVNIKLSNRELTQAQVSSLSR